MTCTTSFLLAALFLLASGAGAASAQLREAAAGPGAPEPTDLERRIRAAGENTRSGGSLVEAYRALRTVDPEELRAAAARLRRNYWWTLGRVAYELGRYEEVRSAADRLLELSRRGGESSADVGGAHYILAVAELEDQSGWPSAERAVEHLRRAVEAAVREETPGYEFLARLSLGKLLGGEEGHLELERALAVARRMGSAEYVFDARQELARQLSRHDPQAGREALERALEERGEDPGSWSIYGWEARLEIMWAALPREQAIEYALGILRRIEDRRRQQAASADRGIGFFSVWVKAYRRVAGLLLEDVRTGAGDEIELAFSLLERMRARGLLDALSRSGGFSSVATDADLLEERARIRRQLVELQRRLVVATGGERQRLLTESELLLLESEAIDRRLRKGDTGEGGPEPRFVGLREVQRALADDEALLVFQVGSWQDLYGAFDGGSWLMLVTSEDAHLVALPDRRDLEVLRDLLQGAIRRRDGSEGKVAGRLHSELLDAALARLPVRVRRLVLVADGPLHGLPFALLAPPDGGEPLLTTYELVTVPSATLWSRLRDDAPPPARPALALVDPRRGDGTALSWVAAGPGTLEPLSAAHREGRSLRRAFGRGSEIHAGASASERALKRQPLERFGFILLAAHAVVDEANPRRSAVVLAPGSEEEDGLLQPPEIADLDLRGRAVALSGCRSASGRAIGGEGLLSLARAFFEAGAPAVVGNLWPVRDAEAAELFSVLFRELGGGETLAAAARTAQLELRAGGATAEAWASMVVLGDGGWRAFPAGPEGSTASPGVGTGVLAAVGLLLLTLLFVVSLRR